MTTLELHLQLHYVGDFDRLDDCIQEILCCEFLVGADGVDWHYGYSYQQLLELIICPDPDEKSMNCHSVLCYCCCCVLMLHQYQCHKNCSAYDFDW